MALTAIGIMDIDISLDKSPLSINIPSAASAIELISFNPFLLSIFAMISAFVPAKSLVVCISLELSANE